MMTTNGTRLESSAQRLVKAPFFALQLSIDGHRAELHNALCPGKHTGGGPPVITAITVISDQNSNHLADIYEAFKDDVDLFVFCLSWWFDLPGANAHGYDFGRRFGFKAGRQWGYVSTQKPQNYELLDSQLKDLCYRSRKWNAKPVSVIPPIADAGNIKAYYTQHGVLFGYRKCLSIFEEVQVMGNGDVSPCRSYADYRVGNVKESTITELWNSPAYRRFRSSLTDEGLMPACSRCCGLMGC